METFKRRLDAVNPPAGGRRWLFVPYDQLTDGLGPLARDEPAELGIVLVESAWKAARRPYHRQKLATVLASLRHFALEQAERGVAVRHVATEGPYRAALEPLAGELGGLEMMEAAERELRRDLAPLVDSGAIEVLPHEGWLTTEAQFAELGEAPWRMDAFYRGVRRDTGILMDDDGKPAGGKYSHDAANRKSWSGEPPAPEPPTFRPDEITEEVGRLVEERFARHPGTLDLSSLPAASGQVEYLWSWARRECMEHFGPFEDAMSVRSSGLFHTRISPLLNLHRLLPRRVVDDVLELDVPLASKEGFVRQVLGWREFVRHVHRATDGFRRLPDTDPPVDDQPGDGGWERWSGERWKRGRTVRGMKGGARPSHLDAHADLPPAFWGETSGLACLDRVVEDVWREGWGHHITRLMVLSNLATLLDVEPRQLTDWFWAAYADAYDWVVEPNVLAMGTFAVGELMTTKPYVSGAAYIDRMSDYCKECRFHPKNDCPVTPLYWAFLGRNAERLDGNPRVAMPLRSLARRGAERRERDRKTFRRVRGRLEAGDEVTPDDFD